MGWKREQKMLVRNYNCNSRSGVMSSVCHRLHQFTPQKQYGKYARQGKQAHTTYMFLRIRFLVQRDAWIQYDGSGENWTWKTAVSTIVTFYAIFCSIIV